MGGGGQRKGIEMHVVGGRKSQRLGGTKGWREVSDQSQDSDDAGR